ncbi:ribonuclease H-like domain-containing protein [Tanacetum coccineum]
MHHRASQHKLWVDAMNVEMDALYRNNIWDVVDLPVRRKAIGSKRVSKIMHNISLFSEPKDNDHLLENVTDYQKLIGKLIYLTTTRPDITYTVSCLSLFMHSPLKSHLKTALKVISLSLRKLVAGVSKLGKDERLELSTSNS